MYSKKIFTIPNILSFVRIMLAVILLDINFKYGIHGKRAEMAAILMISGITDVLDGIIARKFNMISELGKIIDPIADKLTQCVVLICFLSEYETARYVFVLFVIKEIYMGIAGARMIMATGKNDGAKWYGKLSTAFFYAVMFLLIAVPQIPNLAAEAMIAASGALMLMALILYAGYYKRLTEASSVKSEA